MSEIGHNSGMGVEEAAAAMERALAPYAQRRADFEAKAGLATVDDVDSAAAAVDFVRMARTLADKARELLDEVRKPYQDAAEAARNVALTFIENVEASASTVNARLAAYNQARRERAAKAAEEQRAAEAALRAKAGLDTPAPDPAPKTEPVTAAPIRTNFGGRMTDTVKWRPKVTDVTLVPKHILETPKVKAAIEQVARALMQQGIEVPGVEKDTYNSHTIS